MNRNNRLFAVSLLLLFLLSCENTSQCLSWDEFEIAARKCPQKSNVMCVWKYPMKIFKKSTLYLVTHRAWPDSWDGFIVLENQFGRRTPLYNYWGPPKDCPICEIKDSQKKLLDSINQMIRSEEIEPTEINHTDFVNDLMACLVKHSIYDRPDEAGSLWRKYPTFFTQKRKPVNMELTPDGLVFTYLTSLHKYHSATQWTIHTKANGEIISIELKRFNNVLED
jgi:hypothetical protein